MASETEEPKLSRDRSTGNWLELTPLVTLLVLSGLAFAFMRLADEIVEGDLEAFDRAIILIFRDPNDHAALIGPAWLPEMVRDVTSLGSVAVLTMVVLIAVGVFAIRRMWAETALVLGSAIGGQMVASVLKLSFNRARPDLIDNAPQVFTASFPSAHAMLSAVIYLTIGALLARHAPSRALRIYFVAVAVVLTVAIGVSRIMLGVHWPSDVLGGWCVGTAWALACWTISIWLERRHVQPVR